jgi:hypothetical protein
MTSLAWRSGVSRLGLWSGVLLAVASLVGTLVGLYHGFRSGDPLGLATDFAVNVAATTVAAIIAFHLFLAQSRIGGMRAMLRSARWHPQSLLRDDSWLPLLRPDSGPARTGAFLAPEVAMHGVFRSVVVVAESAGGRRTFLVSLIRALARRRRIAVAVGQSDIEATGSLAESARSRFIDEYIMVTKSHPDQADRLWHWLRRHQRIVVLLQGLDQIGMATGWVNAGSSSPTT